MRITRLKLHELNKFIEKTLGDKEWKYCERYILINDVKVRKRFPLGREIAKGMCYYNNGIIIKKTTTGMDFISYTVLGRKCVLNLRILQILSPQHLKMLNHRSSHNKDGDILSMRVNCFDNVIDGVDDDAVDYLNQLLSELIQRIAEKKFDWDIIE
jgi:hypothetical protein